MGQGQCAFRFVTLKNANMLMWCRVILNIYITPNRGPKVKKKYICLMLNMFLTKGQSYKSQSSRPLLQDVAERLNCFAIAGLLSFFFFALKLFVLFSSTMALGIGGWVLWPLYWGGFETPSIKAELHEVNMQWANLARQHIHFVRCARTTVPVPCVEQTSHNLAMLFCNFQLLTSPTLCTNFDDVGNQSASTSTNQHD